MRIIFFLFSILSFLTSFSQAERWQQRVNYRMDIRMDVASNRFSGKQKIEYSNNSSDKLNKLFMHLYWNAFQPGSMMDVRSREQGKKMFNGRPDWDPRVRDRISNLKPEETGYQKILSVKMNGVPQEFTVYETILEVKLKSAILPRSKVIFDVEFEAQVPLQIRRSGRDNPNTGVRYSMTQWYPKICEYDKDGWHPNPYIAREFYGVWGDFEVNVEIDKDYKLGGTGVLTNATEIGWGYDQEGTGLKPAKGEKRTWRFSGKNIHDFAWAADPGFTHITRKTYTGGPIVHVIYKPKEGDTILQKQWNTLADAAVKVLPFIESNFGKYPYPQYSFIHGGDGGMEYAMATLISGPSLGTAFHEWMHSWYQMVLGFNESLYAWMDEGFTNFSEDRVMKYYKGIPSIDEYRNMIKSNPNNENLKNLMQSLPENNSGAYASYFSLVKSGLQEPLTTHADHFSTNYAYSIASYSMGELFLSQLGYIAGEKTRDKILLDFYNRWKFRHPDASDFLKMAEDISGLQLDWYKEYWINTTKTINYSIDSLWEENGRSKIRIRRIGEMPMPVDLQVTFSDSTSEMHQIPLDLMFGSKPEESGNYKWFSHEPWKWTHPVYVAEVNRRLTDIRLVEIDPSKRMADVERKNNRLELQW